MKVRWIILTFLAHSLPAESTESDYTLFESKIRPALIEHCYECHSAEAGKSKGGLLVDSRESLQTGGDTGPAVVPGKPEDSLLIAAISHKEPDFEMPPKKAKLPDAVIADFRSWIAAGAPDPREPSQFTKEEPPLTIEAGREFWAFAPPRSEPPPKTKAPDWARKDLDHFIRKKLEAESITPSPDAAPATLLRRLHFDLIGLPPEPDDLSRFLKQVQSDGIDSALTIETDRLLATERYGERWARHWMDVARFAESSGKESNLTFPHAWRYRDYAIDAFNDDIPFDRFILEQLAGDLIESDSDQERARLLIATGFLAFGTKGLNEMNPAQFAADLIDEQIDTTTRALLAQSIACARCHDHKFGPFHMADYYALAGIFASTETFFGTWIDSENNVGGDLITLPPLKDQFIPQTSIPKAKVEEMKAKVAALNKEEADGRAAVQAAIKEGRPAGDLFTLQDALRIIWTRGGMEGRLETFDEEGNALPLCMGVLDRDKPVDAPLLERGEVAKPGEKISRGFPRIIEIAGMEAPAAKASGRLEFAQWIGHPENPLTARVMVNRIWSHLMGTGIVRTTDNFGFNGERPSHPELLDHLALRFVEEGWSVKAMVRELVLSRTWRQQSDWRTDAFQKDPDNRLLWRASKRRLEAEAIRDAMLSVSGQLDLSRRPGSLVAEVKGQSVAMFGFNKQVPSDLDGTHFRSVYLPVVRDRLPDVLNLFDFAEPSLVTGERDTTNVPVQALYLLNSDFVVEQSRGFSSRLKNTPGNRIEKITLAFQLCYSRDPLEEEIILANRFLEESSVNDTSLAAFCQSLLATAEFRNLD